MLNVLWVKLAMFVFGGYLVSIPVSYYIMYNVVAKYIRVFSSVFGKGNDPRMQEIMDMFVDYKKRISSLSKIPVFNVYFAFKFMSNEDEMFGSIQKQDAYKI